ncbi:MAG: hypothetical protein QOJ39_1290 [Candidatus Eremiobacteraeota bacterium]|jgi:hypothetical protein|nr:hypothetical protein [Candidatus Eremiobacteraeota bacterium]
MTLILEGPVKSTTQLSNETKSLLEHASHEPVIIQRERQQEAIILMNRRVARQAFAAQALLQQVAVVLQYALNRTTGNADAYPMEFEWLRQFDAEDVREFATEFVAAAQRVVQSDRPLEEVQNVIDQWRKSADILRDAELQARLTEEVGRLRPQPAHS